MRDFLLNHTSTLDARPSIRRCIDLALLDESLADERGGMKRKSMIKMLEVRIRKLENS